MKKYGLCFILCSVIIGLTFHPSSVKAAPLAKELHFFNWADYVDENLLKEYQAQYGVKIIIDNYDSDEAMLAKVQAKPTQYDVVIPSDYMIAQMIKLGLLAKLNKVNIPNISNITAFYTNTWFDPGAQYCVPYMWGVTGIAYLSTLTKVPSSWGALFDPTQVKYYSEQGGVNLFDNERELIGAALKYLGYTYNDTDPQHLAKARDTIVAVLPYIHSMNSTDYGASLLLPREVVISQAWNGDVQNVNTSKPLNGTVQGDWKFILPQEGTIHFQDGLCILADSSRKETAEHFINFMIEAKAAARNSVATGSYSTNQAAQAFVDKTLLANYPPQTVLDKLEVIKPLDAETLKIYDKMWADIRATQ